LNEEHSRSNSFVLRIWRDEGGETPTWRGWVQHAASGDACYVCRLADLVAFLEMHTGSLDQKPGGVKKSGPLDGSKHRRLL
jgi:hypothetical protein